MRVDERTNRYAARRASEGKPEGKPKREIIRRLKRYAAREVYRVPPASATFADLPADEGRIVAVTGVT